MEMAVYASNFGDQFYLDIRSYFRKSTILFSVLALTIAIIAGQIIFEKGAFAAGTNFITNGSTSIGTLPETTSLPNTSYRINTSVTNDATVTSIGQSFVGPSGSSADTSGWNILVNGSVDDSSVQDLLGFNTSFNGTTYGSVFIGSNSYFTFGGGSGNYSGLSPSNPALPGVHI